MDEWCDADIFNLIAEWQTKKCLQETTNMDYRNKVKTITAVEDIVEKLGRMTEQIKKKITNYVLNIAVGSLFYSFQRRPNKSGDDVQPGPSGVQVGRKRVQNFVNLNEHDSTFEDNVSSEDENPPCLYCNELYKASQEKWIQCQECRKWAHVKCGGVSYFSETFVCDICTWEFLFKIHFWMIKVIFIHLKIFF